MLRRYRKSVSYRQCFVYLFQTPGFPVNQLNNKKLSRENTQPLSCPKFQKKVFQTKRNQLAGGHEAVNFHCQADVSQYVEADLNKKSCSRELKFLKI